MLFILKNIIDFIKFNLHIFNLFDLVEILILSIIIYKAQIWLSKDKLNNLLSYFYLYATFLIFCYFCNLQVLKYLSLSLFPIIVILIIILHQDILQKNFITNINPIKNKNLTWPTELVKALLYTINNNQEIWCIIEFKSNLNQFIHTNNIINADISKDLLNILLEKQEPKKYMWITSQNKIAAINCDIRINQEDLLNLTTKTDCIILQTNLKFRNFNIIYQNNVLEKVTPQELIMLLEKQIK